MVDCTRALYEVRNLRAKHEAHKKLVDRAEAARDRAGKTGGCWDNPLNLRAYRRIDEWLGYGAYPLAQIRRDVARLERLAAAGVKPETDAPGMDEFHTHFDDAQKAGG